jgi:hypothetical protein
MKTTLTPQERSELAYNTYEHADRIRALVQALARGAESASDEEAVFEAVGCLLDTLVKMTSTLYSEIHETPQTDKPAEEVHP